MRRHRTKRAHSASGRSPLGLTGTKGHEPVGGRKERSPGAALRAALRPLAVFLYATLVLCASAALATAEDIVEVWRGGTFTFPISVSVNQADGSCWVADRDANVVVHLAEDGTELWRGSTFNSPWSVSVNRSDGTCWVADRGNNEIVHLAEDGTELFRGGGFNGPIAVSVNPTDDSCWVSDRSNNQIVHLAGNGTELSRDGGFSLPIGVSANSDDGSCWVADLFNNQAVHLSSAGGELWRGGTFDCPRGVSVNPTDKSCWVADSSNNQIAHLAENGTELWRGSGFNWPWSVSVDPTDGSCWVGDTGNSAVVRLAQDGTELWRSGSFDSPYSVSVNPADGSCWVADTLNSQVVHLGFVYTLSLDGANGQVAVDGAPQALAWSGDYPSGTQVTLEAVPDATYEFSGWAGDLSGSENPVTITIDGDKSITATFAKIQYALTLTGTGAGRVLVDAVEHSLPWSGDFDAGSTVSLEAVADTCYEFTSWSGDLSGSGNPSGVTMDGPKDITAVFSEIQYVLDLSGVGAGAIAVDGTPVSLPWSDSFVCGSSVTLEAVPEPCYGFAGWSGAVSGGGDTTVVTMDGPQSVTATFLLLEYQLSVSGTDGGSVLVDGTPVSLPWSATYPCGSSVTLEAVPDSCYEFGGWSGDLSGDETPTIIMVDGPKAVTGEFLLINYVLSLAGTGGSVMVDGVSCELPWSGTFACGSAITLEAVPDAHKEFMNWSGDLSGTYNPATVTIDGEKAITAHFSLVQHTVVVAAVGSGSIRVNGVAKDLPWSGAFDHGTSLMLEAVPAEGWGLRRWDGDLTGEGNPIAFAVESDMNVLVVFGIVFTDVPHDYWAADAIAALADAGIAGGYLDGRYGPEFSVDRGAMAAYISRALAGGNTHVPDGPEEPTFPDVPSDHWAYRYVEYVVSRDVVAGYGDGEYHSDWTVTRGQMSVFVARSMVDPTGDEGLESYQAPDTPTFTDVPDDYWCFRHVEFLAENGVASGYPDGAYCPTQVVTRDQMAVYIARAFDLLQ